MHGFKTAFAVGELFQRYFLDGAAFPSVAKTRVMNDSSVAHVNAVMRVDSPVGDQMGAGRKWRVHLRAQSTARERDPNTADAIDSRRRLRPSSSSRAKSSAPL